MNKILALIIMIIFLVACASRPVLYPNKKYKRVGKDHADLDINQCENEADKFVNSSKGKRILKEGGKGALLGGIIGAAIGLITGDVGEAVAIGAVSGGVGSAASAGLSPDELNRRYVNYCLQQKGYKVIGWN